MKRFLRVATAVTAMAAGIANLILGMAHFYSYTGTILLFSFIPFLVIGSFFLGEQKSNKVAIALLVTTVVLFIFEITCGIVLDSTFLLIESSVAYGPIIVLLVAYYCFDESYGRDYRPAYAVSEAISQTGESDSTIKMTSEFGKAAPGCELSLKGDGFRKKRKSGEISDEEYQKLLRELLGK